MRLGAQRVVLITLKPREREELSRRLKALGFAPIVFHDSLDLRREGLERVQLILLSAELAHLAPELSRFLPLEQGPTSPLVSVLPPTADTRDLFAVAAGRLRGSERPSGSQGSASELQALVLAGAEQTEQLAAQARQLLQWQRALLEWSGRGPSEGATGEQLALADAAITRLHEGIPFENGDTGSLAAALLREQLELSEAPRESEGGASPSLTASTDAVAIGPWRSEEGTGAAGASRQEASASLRVPEGASPSWWIWGAVLLLLAVAVGVLLLEGRRVEEPAPLLAPLVATEPEDAAGVARALALDRARLLERAGEEVAVRVHRQRTDALDRCREAVRAKEHVAALSLCAGAGVERPEVARALGESFMALGFREDGLSLLRHAVEQDPLVADGWLLLGDALAELGRPEEARAAWSRYLELEPGGQYADAVRRIIAEEDAADD